MVYSKQLFRTVLLILLSFLSIELCAQATIDELLDGYVSSSVKGESATPYTTKINQIYKNYRIDQQESLRSIIYDRVVGDTIIEQNKLKGKFALIDLYALLADSDDSKLDDLYFKKGEICGLHTGDTIMLKECITSLKLSDHSKTDTVKEYVNTLQEYLEEIRNYLPVSQRIDGVWVSNRIKNINWVDKYIYYTPSFVLNINNGKIKLENIGHAILFADFSFWSNKVKNDENTYAEKIIDIGKDKVYMVWSNEKLKIPNQAVALSLGQSAGDIATEATRQATKDVVGNIGGDVVGGIAGNIIGSTITDMFAPSKKIYVLEMELEKINESELKGRFYWQVIKVDGNGKPEIHKEEDIVCFVKYDIESGVYFGSSGNMYKYIPGCEISKEFPVHYETKFIELSKKYQNASYTHKNINWTHPKFQSYFSALQIKKLIYFAEQKLLQQGYKDEELCYNRQTAVMGVIVENRNGEKIELPKDMNGVYVYDVISEKSPGHAPAFLFGIKKGDIIMSVDGYEMDSPEKFIQFIRSLKPYDWVTIHIKRGKKEMDIEVELTWY